jgi:hypothetical protein
MKTLIWLGLFLGSALGGWLPTLAGADMLSLWGVLGSVVGGLAGIWAGMRAARAFGV